MVLNRNPGNYFAEIEQLAFSPAHMVPGIEPSPDKMLQVGVARLQWVWADITVGIKKVVKEKDINAITQLYYLK